MLFSMDFRVISYLPGTYTEFHREVTEFHREVTEFHREVTEFHGEVTEFHGAIIIRSTF